MYQLVIRLEPHGEHWLIFHDTFVTEAPIISEWFYGMPGSFRTSLSSNALGVEEGIPQDIPRLKDARSNAMTLKDSD